MLRTPAISPDAVVYGLATDLLPQNRESFLKGAVLVDHDSDWQDWCVLAANAMPDVWNDRNWS
ncbi:hypothetical protein [Fimbriiglobus ruber]|nr:hypothetical protein [Fimbriiglobus ruber]